MIASLCLAVIAFASTNIDGMFVLLIFFADSKFRVRDVVAGEYIGIAALYGVSVACSLTSLAIPKTYIGLLGLVPIVIGAQKLYHLWRDRAKTEEAALKYHDTGAHSRVFSVAAVTMANGGDNIGVSVALFVTRSGYEIAAMGLVFAAMTAVWCFAAHGMVQHPTLGAPIRRYGPQVAPFVLMGLGVLILFESGSLELLASRI